MPKFQKLLLILVFTIIGLSSATLASAAGNVYYSVGQSTANLMTGTPNVAITSGVATFDVAQTANIGVGDVIVANAISYYISSKTSTTVWNVVTNTGATPTDITSTAVTSVKHVYTSLNSAVTGASTLLGSSNLTTADVVLNIPCYYDSGPDTTAVTVSGYTTDSTRYIKIYTPVSTTTEANNSQRHKGVAMSGGSYSGYVLKDSTNYTVGLRLQVDYVHIDGLIIERAATDGYNNISSNGYVSHYISNNILLASAVTLNNPKQGGISLYSGTSSPFYVWNNIIYSSVSGGHVFGIYIGYHGYVYNNTIFNINGQGIQANYSSVTVKNNIVQNCSSGYVAAEGGSFINSVNNLSSDATSPNAGATDCGGHSCRNQTVAFISTTSGSEDLHLLPSDTAAKNSGADLSADANLAFATDIDGQTRNLRSEGWDIGADEAAAQIFYSVGQNTNDHKTGSPLVTVAGTTATFDTAQTATNMGVGDLVTYTGGTCYISAKTSTTVWSCISATGGAPAAVTNATVTSIAHAFASLSAAMSGSGPGASNSSHLNTTNLVTNNYQLNIPCYYDSGADTTRGNVYGFTTGANNYIRLYTPNNVAAEVNLSQRHQGKWDDAKYRFEYTATGSSDYALYIQEPYIKIDGLQIKSSDGGYGYSAGIGINSVYSITSSNLEISNNIIKAGTLTNATVAAAGIGNYSGGKSLIYNNVIYGFNVDGSSTKGRGFHIRGSAYVYNNTFYDCYHGIYNYDGTAYAKNNIAQSCTDGYAGSFTSSDYNISNVAADAPSASYRSGLATTAAFADVGNKDFHLASTDTAARNSGADLSADTNLPFATDIDGAPRNAAINPWDIGADETATQIFRSVGPGATAWLATDSGHANTVTVTSGVATFSAALADTIGVGDAVIIDTGGTDQTIDASDTISFISARTDSTHYTLQTQAGAVPSNIASNDTYQIYRAYTSLSLAEAGTKNTSIPISFTGGDRNIASSNEQWNIACYANGTTADTTAVLVSGWTTAQQDFIKIYTPVATTEVGTSQRHSGKWDATKYNISINANYTVALESQLSYTKIIGLQIANASTTAYANFDVGGTSSIIDQCIGKSSSATYSNFYTHGPIIITNSLADGGNQGFLTGYGSVIYNSTAVNCTTGFYTGDFASVVFKNDLAYGNTTGFAHSGAAYDWVYVNCASSDASAGTGSAGSSGNRTNQTFSFIDATNHDFHLAATDAGAKNYGADLSADTTYAFSTDIDGQTRSASPSWDIGADEAANAVYYSVGQSTADLKTGTPNVAITAGVATFDVAQTGNIGVGDVIVANAISYYISSKTSTTVWNVVTVTGAVPTNITSTAVTSIKHVYSSLNSAAAGAGTLLGSFDLATANVILNIPCYYDSGADTTAVTVSGYTTTAPNYIRIYTPYNTSTEANNSQRASGKWDDGKYRLNITSSYSYPFRIITNYTKVIGIQENSNNVNDSYGGFHVNGNYVTLDSCIAKNNSNYTYGGFFVSSLHAFLVNCLAYDNAAGFVALHYEKYITYYNCSAINNTLYGFDLSYISATNSPTLKNNLASGNGTKDFYWNGDYQAPTLTNCASGDNSATSYAGANNRANQTFSFVDAINKDFHLAATDAGAKNYGADLSADTNFAFTTDIDGQTRNLRSEGWDIGADEAATQIFYSVGQNTADHKTGTPTVTVSGTTATFSVAQTATNMGVGDLVTYTGGTCYLSAKTSTTVWSCVNVTGGQPAQVAGVSVTSIAHAFASLDSATSGASNSSHLNTVDLVAGNYQLNIPCYYDSGPNTTGVLIDGYTTGPQNYIRIYTPTNTTSEANQSQRHIGQWDNSKFSLSYTASGSYYIAVQIYDDFVKLDGLQVLLVPYNGNAAIGVAYLGYSNKIEISNNIIRKSVFSDDSSGIGFGGFGQPENVYIYNNIIYGFRRDDGYGSGIYSLNPSGTSYVYNNTVYNCGRSINNSSGTMITKNNVVQNSAVNYNGSFDASSVNNISADATSPNAGGTDCGGHSCRSQTVTFTDTTNNDLHLASTDTTAKNSGTDLSADTNLPFSTDIDSQVREVNKWDIGADEFWAAQLGGAADGSGGSASSQGAITTPPIASYNFNDGYGATLANLGSGGATFNGTLNAGAGGTNTTATAMWDKGGKFGGGMEFDGTDDYVTMGDATNLDGVAAFSVSFWTKISSLQTSRRFISKWGSSGSEESFIVSLDDTNPDEIIVAAQGPTGSTDVFATTDANLVTNQWYNISFVWTDNSRQLYINGALYSLNTLSDGVVGSIRNSATPLEIGASYNNTSGNSEHFFPGLIDDVKVFNYALSSDQIKTLYNNNAAMSVGNDASRNNNGTAVTGANKDYCIPGDTAQCDKPVGEWKMDEKVSGDVKTIYDTSGNGNNGTTHWGANASGMDCSIPGKYGAGCGFDGVDDYVVKQNPVGLDNLSMITISFWAKFKSFYEWEGVMNRDGANIIISSTNVYPNQLVFLTSVGNVLGVYPVIGTWAYYSYTYDGSKLRSYLNGRLQGETNASGNIVSSGDLNIGFRDYSGTYFDGSLDDFKIYNYARTPAQIAWDFNKGGPVAEWRMNECSGASIGDDSGNGNTGTLNLGASGQTTTGTCTASANTPWYNGRTGKFGASLNFDGADDYVDTGVNMTNVNYPFSISFFGKLNSTINQNIVLSYVGSTGDDTLGMEWTNATAMDFNLGSYTNGGYTYFTATVPPKDTNWHHFTLIANSYTSMSFYMDGISYSISAGTKVINPVGTTLRIGGRGTTNGWDGQIDNVKVFNYALTPLQVQADYNNGAVGF